MSNVNHDAETKQALSEADALQAMFELPGWAVAERLFNEMIADLKDVTLIDPADDVSQTVRDRINTVKALQYWMSELKGRVANASLMHSEISTSVLIERR